jgi:hypothetical protein
MSDSNSRSARAPRKPFPVLAVAAAVIVAALASTARADDSIVSAGPLTSPNGATPVSASVGSNGKTDACVTGQQSWADASGAEPNGPAQVNSGPCEANGTAGAGSSGGGSPASTTSRPAAGRSPTGGSGSSSKAALNSVAAADAVGLRIASVRYGTSAVAATRRLRVVVALRDSHGRRVRGAIVLLRGVPRAETTISRADATFSDRLGQARFNVEVARSTLGKPLLLTVIARTPTASAHHVGVVRLPGPLPR